MNELSKSKNKLLLIAAPFPNLEKEDTMGIINKLGVFVTGALRKHKRVIFVDNCVPPPACGAIAFTYLYNDFKKRFPKATLVYQMQCVQHETKRFNNIVLPTSGYNRVKILTEKEGLLARAQRLLREEFITRELFDAYEELLNESEKYMVASHLYYMAIDSIAMNSRVLYIGCGTGYFLRFFKNTKEFVGVDYPKEKIETAKKTTSSIKTIDIKFFCGTFDDYFSKLHIDGKGEKFDVIALGVYGISLPYSIEILNNAKSILDKGGFIFCPVPDHYFNFVIRLKGLIKQFLKHQNFQYDPEKNFKNCCKKAGLEIYGKLRIRPSYCNMYILEHTKE